MTRFRVSNGDYHIDTTCFQCGKRVQVRSNKANLLAFIDKPWPILCPKCTKVKHDTSYPGLFDGIPETE